MQFFDGRGVMWLKQCIHAPDHYIILAYACWVDLRLKLPNLQSSFTRSEEERERESWETLIHFGHMLDSMLVPGFYLFCCDVMLDQFHFGDCACC